MSPSEMQVFDGNIWLPANVPMSKVTSKKVQDFVTVLRIRIKQNVSYTALAEY
jgi:hypothetical protein